MNIDTFALSPNTENVKIDAEASAKPKDTPMRDAVTKTMENYFSQVDVKTTTDVYDMVLSEVEEPLLKETMKFTRGNQSRAAIVLGLSRGTLRKKLKRYGLD